MNGPSWIDELARHIRLNWQEWQAEADTLAQVEQSHEAGEGFMHQRLVDAIMEALVK